MPAGLGSTKKTTRERPLSPGTPNGPIAFSKGNVRCSKLKHIDVRQQCVEWLRDRDIVLMSHVDTKINPADFFTKILDFETFDRLRSLMMVNRPMDDDILARL